MTQQASSYKVLARTKRPLKFSELLGQEVLVQTIKNGLEQDRLPHAFILTGIRGVGKTTTARLIARSLNCTGPDGKGGITMEPCGVCESCISISEDRHMDVIEVDAASRTGVDDMRELMEGLSYRPVMGRYKVYIIDEVHMLSKNAFNALLKTLEEPPTHVKFIFATTEIGKVPVTILSRCQRFDLRRFDGHEITEYFSKLLREEKIKFELEALEVIAKSSEGSMRDALSLLEQAITVSNGNLTEKAVRDMLGLADQSKLLTLFGHLMKGQIVESLALSREICSAGGEPEALVQDLMRLIHELMIIKTTQKSVKDPQKKELSEKTSVPDLSQAWQILMRGLEEMKLSSLPFEMMDIVLIRVAYVQEMVAEAENIKSEPVVKAATVGAAAPKTKTDLKSFEEVVSWCEAQKEPLMAAYLKEHVSLIEFKPSFMKLSLLKAADTNIPLKLKKFLVETTGASWIIETSAVAGQEPLLAQEQKKRQKELEKVMENPDIQAVTEMFPGAKVQIK
ncbi:MAG: DNA polymerase III subunit gamma/tau [Alphaproteobacteria bacterium]